MGNLSLLILDCNLPSVGLWIRCDVQEGTERKRYLGHSISGFNHKGGWSRLLYQKVTTCTQHRSPARTATGRQGMLQMLFFKSRDPLTVRPPLS